MEIQSGSPRSSQAIRGVILANAGSGYNDGYADNISLMLLPRAVIFLPALWR